MVPLLLLLLIVLMAGGLCLYGWAIVELTQLHRTTAGVDRLTGLQAIAGSLLKLVVGALIIAANIISAIQLSISQILSSVRN